MSTNDRNAKHDRTLDLFSNAPSGNPSDALRGGDGQDDFSGNLESPQSTTMEALPLPALADVDLSVPQPFRVPGLKGEVLPVPVFSLRLVRERDHHTKMIHAPADVARLCSEMLSESDREVFLVIALSTSNRVVGAHVAHVGTVDASIASPRECFKFALLCNARSIVVAHNHPSGNLEPSSADVQVSKQLKAAGDVLGIRLLDSLVIGHPEGKSPRYTSLAEKGLL